MKFYLVLFFAILSSSVSSIGRAEDIMAAKNEVRDKIRAAAGFTILSDSPEKLENLIDTNELSFINGTLIRKLSDIDSRNFQKGRVQEDVWSGSIWHQYRGLTSLRYMVPEAANAPSWQAAFQFISEPGQTFFDVATQGTDEDRDILGPAEKYDLLIGRAADHKGGILSKYEWDQGADSLKRYGKVAKWYGYCHGWAAASFSVPRPTSTVEVPSADGTRTIRFYPHDLKALATVLWANALPQVRLVGARCLSEKPQRDKDGRILDPNCLGVSPGIFHLALVNQLQGAHRVLLMDADYDIQVWNQPIIAYSYRYFNPENPRKVSPKFESSVIAVDAFATDKYKKYRSPDARKIVGVEMKIEYGQGTKPNHNPIDGPQYDQSRHATYKYDLELNAAGEVIGGEWYQIRHPGFLWVVPIDSLAASDFESEAEGAWNPSRSVPALWSQAAEKSANKGQPLAKIVKKLIELSRQSP